MRAQEIKSKVNKTLSISLRYIYRFVYLGSLVLVVVYYFIILRRSNILTIYIRLQLKFFHSRPYQSQVGKSACIVLAKERHSKGERVPFSACFQLVSKLKSEAASTLSLMFQILLKKITVLRGMNGRRGGGGWLLNTQKLRKMRSWKFSLFEEDNNNNNDQPAAAPCCLVQPFC